MAGERAALQRRSLGGLPGERRIGMGVRTWGFVVLRARCSTRGQAWSSTFMVTSTLTYVRTESIFMPPTPRLPRTHNPFPLPKLLFITSQAHNAKIDTIPSPFPPSSTFKFPAPSSFRTVLGRSGNQAHPFHHKPISNAPNPSNPQLSRCRSNNAVIPARPKRLSSDR